MMLIIILSCLTGGIALVVIAQYPAERADRLERIGGMLLVTGLVGLGFIMNNRS